MDEPHGRKVPEDLVRRRKVPHAVLVLDNLLDIFLCWRGIWEFVSELGKVEEKAAGTMNDNIKG